MAPDSSVESLRAQRDRFVAFAYATSDLLFEIDNAGRLQSLFGVAAPLVKESDGRAWPSLFAESDAAPLAARLERLTVGERAGPLPVTLRNGQRGRLSLLRLTRDMVHGAVTELERRDALSGLLTLESFLGAATAAGGRVTVVELHGLEDLRQRNPDEAEDLIASVGRFLALEGLAAGRLADNRFGLVTVGAPTAGRIERNIGQIARAHDPEGTLIAAASAQLSAEETGRALMVALNRFASDGIVTTEAGLRDLADVARAAAGEMAAFKQIVGSQTFNLVFQPICEIASRRVHHWEVLTRFTEQDSPWKIINFAEQAGVIQTLDLSVVRRALRVLEGKLTNPDLSLAVNISGFSFSHDAFLVEFLRLLSANRTLSKRLMFEITESSRIPDLERAARVAADIRGRGFRLCLDDFGAGASSFHYLRAMVVDFVKIDGSYVLQMQSSPRDLAMIRAMTQLCHELGIATIGEMVETQEQARALVSLGVKLAQGWLYGRPQAQPGPALAAA